MASGITKESWFHRLTEIMFVHKLLSASKATPSWVSRKITAQNGPTSINFLWQTWIPWDLSRPQNGQRSLLQPLCDLSDDEGEETKGSTALKGWNLRTKLLGFQGWLLQLWWSSKKLGDWHETRYGFWINPLIQPTTIGTS